MLKYNLVIKTQQYWSLNNENEHQEVKYTEEEEKSINEFYKSLGIDRKEE